MEVRSTCGSHWSSGIEDLGDLCFRLNFDTESELRKQDGFQETPLGLPANLDCSSPLAPDIEQRSPCRTHRDCCLKHERFHHDVHHKPPCTAHGYLEGVDDVSWRGRWRKWPYGVAKDIIQSGNIEVFFQLRWSLPKFLGLTTCGRTSGQTSAMVLFRRQEG